MRKKILSEILILVMLVSILPTSDVNAISTEETPTGIGTIQESVNETIESTAMIPDSYTPDASENMGVSEDTDVSETADVLDSADSEEYTDEETTTPSPKEGVVYILGKRRTGSIEKKVEGYFNDMQNGSILLPGL